MTTMNGDSYDKWHALHGHKTWLEIAAEHSALLEALERTLSWLTSYPGGGTMGANGPYEQAIAAIARAKSTT